MKYSILFIYLFIYFKLAIRCKKKKKKTSGSGRVRALNLTVPLGSGRVGSDDLGYGLGSGFSFKPLQTSTPLTTATSVSFFLTKLHLFRRAERLYDHIKRETFRCTLHFALVPGTSQKSSENSKDDEELQ